MPQLENMKYTPKRLNEIANEVKICVDCSYHLSRNIPIVGNYNPDNPILFISDIPTYLDDSSGNCMIGRDGKIFNEYLNDILGLTRPEVNILYAIKCKPPENRLITKVSKCLDQLFWCSYHIYRQILLLQPKLCIMLGHIPSYLFLQPKNPDFTLGTGRNKAIPFQEMIGKFYEIEIPVPEWFEEKPNNIFAAFSTYHPKGWLINKENATIAKNHFYILRDYIRDI